MPIKSSSPADEAIIERIRDAVRELEPGARAILYGSRARGDAQGRDPAAGGGLAGSFVTPAIVRRLSIRAIVGGSLTLPLHIHWPAPPYAFAPHRVIPSAREAALILVIQSWRKSPFFARLSR